MRNLRMRITLTLALATALAGTTFTSSAQVTEMLHETQDGTRDNYTGVVGGAFKVGSSNVVVSHLGVYDNNGDGLAQAHHAGIFTAGGVLIGEAAFAAGTGAYLTNSTRWMPLDPPLLLEANTTYVLASDVFNASGDPWKDSFAPTNWNTRFVGTNAASTRNTRYSPGGAAWPTFPASGFGSDTTYGNVNLAYIEIGPARVGVQTTNVSLSAGQTLSVTGFASGESAIHYQWYLAPDVPLSDQTNATLVIPGATTNNSGVYFLTASNSLGGEQSAAVTVSVTSFPVGITQQPTNLTVFGNYPASFSLTATGSPPVSYQWFRNGAPIDGATGSTYAIAAAATTNNGDVYSCVVSNFTSGTPYTATSDNATLTVTPNLALPQQFLHGSNTNLSQNSFAGMVGGLFTVGNSPVLVTHLGYYAPTSQYTDPTNCNLTQSHRVGIFNAAGNTLLGYVTVPSGVGPVVNGYLWAPLEPPLVLSNNTQYLLATEVFSGVDPWGNTYAVPDLNPYFATACAATYWGAAWPGGGAAGAYGGQMYSAPNLAVLALPTPSAYVSPLTVTQYVGYDATLAATVAGEPPVTLGWFKDSAPISGQNDLILNLNSLTSNDAGNYYVIATNLTATAQSSNATVTVLPDTGPIVTSQPQSQNAFIYQNVTFSVEVSGPPPFVYQWTFNGAPITDATNQDLTIRNVTAANVGDYRLAITNDFGATNTDIATLTVTVPGWGTYPSAVMGADLLAYYRFNDVNNGTGVATNQGALGLGYNGTYEGGYAGDAGPLAPNFEPGNLSVSLDGLTADVLVPSPGGTLTNATIAAWVYKGVSQVPDAAIFWHRASSVFGLSVHPDPVTSADSLRYTWNGTYYNFESGLILPTNQWALVALSVTPTEASLYLQDGAGLQSTNNLAAHPSQSTAGTSYVGWDTAGGDIGRRWEGDIDEVMLFNRALSPVEINALYLGVPGSATLTIAPSGNNVVLTWPGGTLLEADAVAGPWTTNSAATSPYTVPATAVKKFYRVQLQP